MGGEDLDHAAVVAARAVRFVDQVAHHRRHVIVAAVWLVLHRDDRGDGGGERRLKLEAWCALVWLCTFRWAGVG